MKYQSIPNNQASILQQSLKFFYSLSTKNLNTLDMNSKEREVPLSCSKLSRQTVRNLSLLKSESSMKVIKKESNTFKENRIFSERSHPASTSYKLTNHSISLRRKNPKMFKFTSSKKWNFVMKIQLNIFQNSRKQLKLSITIPRFSWLSRCLMLSIPCIIEMLCIERSSLRTSQSQTKVSLCQRSNYATLVSLLF